MAQSCINKISDFLWKQGDPPISILESPKLTSEKLFILRVVGLVISVIGWILMLVVDGSNHFIYLTYWGVYASVALFALLLFQHKKYEKYQSESPQSGDGAVRDVEIAEEKSHPYSYTLLWKWTVVFYECTVAMSLMIGFVYWVSLFSPSITTIRLIASIFVHGVIQICWIAEFWADRIPFYRHHYWVFLTIGAIYLVWNAIWSLAIYPVYGNFTTWTDFLTLIFVLGALIMATLSFFLLECLYRKKLSRVEGKTDEANASAEDGREMTNLKKDGSNANL